MHNILILDDSQRDVALMQEAMDKLINYDGCNIFASNSPSDFSYYDELTDHQIDLVILDLEFTNNNISSIIYIDNFPDQLPIIVVSHLQHYQHRLQSKLNVKGFIPKDLVKENLLPLVEEILYGKKAYASEEIFTFPCSKSNIPFTKETIQIQFFELVKRGIYHIHLTDRNIVEIQSSSFRRILLELNKQNIKNLHPVCRGEVINVNYIKSIKRDDDGRIEIYLINLPTHPFHVGKQYESYYIPFLPYSRRRENKENHDNMSI